MTTPRRPVALACGLVALSFGCGGKGSESREARPVRIENVRTEDEGGRIRYSATIQAYEQVALAFKTSGYVREMAQRKGSDGRLRYVQQGDDVKRGTVLARIVDADYQERANQARSQVVEASASLEKARADGGRAERLYAAQSLTRPDYDAARANLAMAEAHAAGARANAETAEISLRDTALVAPLDGVVLSRQVEVGSLAAPGTPGFVIADLTRVKAVFGVPDRLAAQARTGTALSITSDAFGDTPFPGQITAISPAADMQSRVFNVEVTIANPRRLLKPGMIATVDVPEATAAAAAGVPGPKAAATVALSAIVKGPKSGGYAVFVAEGPEDKTVARAREVTLGPIAGNRVTVTGGLKVGERVIVSGASFLHDGDAVRIVPGSERS